MVRTSILVLFVSLLSAACATPGSRTPAQRNVLVQESHSAMARFRARDPGIERFFETASGYAVFPLVGKGGLWLGGAHGNGTVYEQDALIGYGSLTQVTVGLQAGAQAYDEIIFFQNQAALDRFRQGNYEVAAQVGGVVVTLGASSTARYQDGVAIFTLPRGGLMYEASVGGQKFSFRPLTAGSLPPGTDGAPAPEPAATPTSDASTPAPPGAGPAEPPRAD